MSLPPHSRSFAQDSLDTYTRVPTEVAVGVGEMLSETRAAGLEPCHLPEPITTERSIIAQAAEPWGEASREARVFG